MPDEEAEESRSRDPSSASDGASSNHVRPTNARDRDEGATRTRERDESGGLGFSLPPISLPELRLPERVRLAFPFPDPPEKRVPTARIRVSHLMLAVLLADALDALAVVWAGPSALPWARAAAGTLLSVAFAGPLGLVYGWELLAILGGVGWLSVAPTLTLLVLARTVTSE